MEQNRYQKLVEGFVECLEPYDFHWWGTLEFSPKKPLKDPIRAKGYVTQYIKNNFDLPDRMWPSYFMSVEHFKSNFFTHVHFMLAGVCEGLSSKIRSGNGCGWIYCKVCY